MISHPVIEDRAEKCGLLRAEAMRVGGDLLYDKVEGALGVAARHINRVRDGVLSASVVMREIDASIYRAEKLVEQGKRDLASRVEQRRKEIESKLQGFSKKFDECIGAIRIEGATLIAREVEQPWASWDDIVDQLRRLAIAEIEKLR